MPKHQAELNVIEGPSWKYETPLSYLNDNSSSIIQGARGALQSASSTIKSPTITFRIVVNTSAIHIYPLNYKPILKPPQEVIVGPYVLRTHEYCGVAPRSYELVSKSSIRGVINSSSTSSVQEYHAHGSTTL